jgi:Cu2+-exporting ATPase
MWYVYVAKDEQLLGRIDCYDRVRPESQAVITALRDRGLEVHMVTSNSQEVAKIVATALELPMSFIHADLHPEQKLRLVQEWQAAGKTVVYIGEGIDDYVALRAADVAVGSHRSCPLNRETADLLLPNDNLHSLLAIMDMAQTAIEIIHQNIALIAIPNISVVALGMIFALNPIIAVIVSQSVNLLAEINGLRPLWAGGKRKKASGTAPTKVYSATHFG